MKTIRRVVSWVAGRSSSFTESLIGRMTVVYSNNSCTEVIAELSAIVIRPLKIVKITGTSLLLAAHLQGCASLGTNSSAGAEELGQSSVSADQLMDIVQQAELAYQGAQWSDASLLYRKLVNVLPDDPYAWFRLGNSLTQQGQYSQAINAYEQSLDYDAVQAKPWFNMSTTYLLGAQVASLKAWESPSINSDTREVARQRLDVLAALLR